MVRRVVHHHHHHQGGGNGQWLFWLIIGLAVASLVVRVLLWVAALVVGAFLIYVLRRPIWWVLVLIWTGVTFVGRSIGSLFKRRAPAPKLLEPPTSP